MAELFETPGLGPSPTPQPYEGFGPLLPGAYDVGYGQILKEANAYPHYLEKVRGRVGPEYDVDVTPQSPNLYDQKPGKRKITVTQDQGKGSTIVQEEQTPDGTTIKTTKKLDETATQQAQAGLAAPPPQAAPIVPTPPPKPENLYNPDPQGLLAKGSISKDWDAMNEVDKLKLFGSYNRAMRAMHPKANEPEIASHEYGTYGKVVPRKELEFMQGMRPKLKDNTIPEWLDRGRSQLKYLEDTNPYPALLKQISEEKAEPTEPPMTLAHLDTRPANEFFNWVAFNKPFATNINRHKEYIDNLAKMAQINRIKSQSKDRKSDLWKAASERQMGQAKLAMENDRMFNSWQIQKSKAIDSQNAVALREANQMIGHYSNLMDLQQRGERINSQIDIIKGKDVQSEKDRKNLKELQRMRDEASTRSKIIQGAINSGLSKQDWNQQALRDAQKHQYNLQLAGKKTEGRLREIAAQHEQEEEEQKDEKLAKYENSVSSMIKSGGGRFSQGKMADKIGQTIHQGLEFNKDKRSQDKMIYLNVPVVTGPIFEYLRAQDQDNLEKQGKRSVTSVAIMADDMVNEYKVNHRGRTWNQFAYDWLEEKSDTIPTDYPGIFKRELTE
jgi:hypothetical protein